MSVMKAVAVRRHRNQIDAPFCRRFDQFGRRIAHRELGFDGAARVPVELAAQLLEVGAIRFHLLRLAQLELIEVAAPPSRRRRGRAAARRR